ncbi:pre-60S ribosomal particles component [Pichia californica]|nr:pre-60S ribosomal particles component [[Candida] californica]
MGKPNRELLSGGKRYKEARKLKHRVSEVVFDKEKRQDYLTGFHKRKLERKKKAQDYLEEQAKKDRLEERAKIREERKLQVQKKLAEMKQAMELNPFLDKNDKYFSDSENNDDDDDDDDDEDDEEEDNEFHDARENISDVKFADGLNSEEEWLGIDDKYKDNVESTTTQKKVKSGILKKQIYDIDNDDAPVIGMSEVTIENLENPNFLDLQSVTKQMNVDLTKTADVLNGSITRAKKYARLMGMSDSPEKTESVKGKVSKPKKKKFRYLSKTERKMKNMKEKNKAFKRKKKD